MKRIPARFWGGFLPWQASRIPPREKKRRTRAGEARGHSPLLPPAACEENSEKQEKLRTKEKENGKVPPDKKTSWGKRETV